MFFEDINEFQYEIPKEYNAEIVDGAIVFKKKEKTLEDETREAILKLGKVEYINALGSVNEVDSAALLSLEYADGFGVLMGNVPVGMGKSILALMQLTTIYFANYDRDDVWDEDGCSYAVLRSVENGEPTAYRVKNTMHNFMFNSREKANEFIKKYKELVVAVGDML